MEKITPQKALENIKSFKNGSILKNKTKATINGAFAMELEKDYGSIAIGKKANFIITKPINSAAFIPYSFGKDAIDQVIINGKKI